MKDIKQFEGGSNDKYKYKYTETLDEEKNIVTINAQMEIDLKSKAAKNKLNKAWEKDKSPLLIELQKIFKEHEQNKRKDKEKNWYTPIE